MSNREQSCCFREAAQNVLEQSNEALFYKIPRGQLVVDQNARWHRCVDLLATAAQLRELVEQ